MQQQFLSSGHILTTKLRIPTLAHTIVERPRLHALLDHTLRQPLALLSAPPGFGKTTLVADWLRRTHVDIPHAWVTLSHHDNQLAAFWSYIVAAVDAAISGGANQFAASLHTATTHAIESALVQLINTLSEHTSPLILVIDNYQYITLPEIHDSLAFMIEHLPEQVHVVVITNHDPALPLPRWRARGLVAEIHADQLACTPEEASTFCTAEQLGHSPDDIGMLVQHTEGWFAGLRLISAAFHQTSDIRTFLSDSRGSCVHEYLISEVLAEQPNDVRAFLLHTSVLEDMCADLCDTVLSVDEANVISTPSYSVLRKLERLNLFIAPLDDARQWFRYHRLFREALRDLLAQEEPGLFETLSLRASEWYHAHNQLEAAIVCALRGRAWEQATGLIEQWLREVTHQRQAEKLHRASAWIAQLPTPIVRERQSLGKMQTAKRAAVVPDAGEALLELEVGSTVPIRQKPAMMTWDELSAREEEVLTLIAEGASNYEIADTLSLSLHTVKRHTSNILAKLNAANRTQAVAYARTYGILSAEHATSHATSDRLMMESPALVNRKPSAVVNAR